MLTKLCAGAVALTLALAACQTGPGTPVVVPPIQMPAEVQQACQVLSWAVPVLSGMGAIPASLQGYVAAAGPAVAACASGNATAAIIDLATALQRYLMARGVHPPVGVPILRR